MRISDWSSDVCSSDLSIGRARRIGVFLQLAAHRGADLRLGQVDRTGIGAREAGHIGPPRQFRKVRLFDRFQMALGDARPRRDVGERRSEEHTSELQSLMRNSYAVFCLKKTNKPQK